MSRIPDSVIEQIQNATDVVGLVQSYVPLKRAGANFKGVCPFHSEKTPSFMVSPTKQIYHCFGCGVGGNVFHFLMAMEKMSFVEAVRELAQKANIPIPETSSPQPQNSFQKTYYELCQSAARFYTRVLHRHPQAMEYLKKRGLSTETIELFQLGYIPKAWSELMDAAKKKGFTPQQLERAGLAIQGRSGWHDRFVERIIFPICDIKGRPIAFGGRAVGDAMPKYLNSPETEFFKKRNTLYGLNWTKGEIIKKEQVLVLEGYMDLISLYQAGFKHCAATLGTALTTDHVRLLTRFAQEIIISYDGDKAGEDASLRGIDLFVKTGAQVRILKLPDGFDPDTFILQKGADAFQKLIDSAPFFLDYKLDKLCQQHDPSTPYGQRDIARGMLSLISRIEDELLRNAWLKKCAERLRMSEKVLLEQLHKGSDRPAAAEVQQPPAEVKEPDLLSVEAELLRLLFEKPEWALEACQQLEPADFKDPYLGRCFVKIQELVSKGVWNGVHSLISGMEDSENVSFLSALSAREMETENLQESFQRTLTRLRRIRLEREIETLNRELIECERTRQEVGPILQEIMDKRKELEKIVV